MDTYTYDGNGNETSEVSTDPITSPYYDNQHFFYNAQEQPVTVTVVSKGSVITGTFGYNAAGQAITYTAVMSGQVIASDRYAYDGNGALAQTIATTATLNADGTIQSSGAYIDTYAYDPFGQPLYLLRQQAGSTKGYVYLTDGKDSVVGLADSAGSRVDRYQYAPYGAPIGLGFWETVPQPFRNLGTVNAPGLGLSDPDGNFNNVGSDTGIIADKSAGFFSNISFGDDPLDYGNETVGGRHFGLSSQVVQPFDEDPPGIGNDPGAGGVEFLVEPEGKGGLVLLRNAKYGGFDTPASKETAIRLAKATGYWYRPIPKQPIADPGRLPDALEGTKEQLLKTIPIERRADFINLIEINRIEIKNPSGSVTSALNLIAKSLSEGGQSPDIVVDGTGIDMSRSQGMELLARVAGKVRQGGKWKMLGRVRVILNDEKIIQEVFNGWSLP